MSGFLTSPGGYMISSQELLRMIDEAGLELVAKPDQRIGPAITKLLDSLNKADDDSEE